MKRIDGTVLPLTPGESLIVRLPAKAPLRGVDVVPVNVQGGDIGMQAMLWAEIDDLAIVSYRSFQWVPVGQALPIAHHEHVGCVVLGPGAIWHLYELIGVKVAQGTIDRIEAGVKARALSTIGGARS